MLLSRLSSGAAASCSNRCSTPSIPMQRLAPRPISSSSRIAAFSSPSSLSRSVSGTTSNGTYRKSPGVRARLEAGAAARGKPDAGPTTTTSFESASTASSQPPPPSAPRRTVEQIVKRITRADVALQFARSGGAGGQNVNKVNTKADLRLNLDSTDWLDPELVEAVKRAEKKRINKEGELVVTSTASRSQAANVDDALEKMQSILDRAAATLIPPEVDPEKAKQIEKALKAGNEARLDLKKKKADKKKERRAPIDW